MTNQVNKAPAGATHRYEHGGLISWYRETDSGLFVWRDGSWCGAAFKTTKDLMNSCMLGRLEAIPAMPALQAEDDLTWLVRESRGEWFGSHPTHIARDGDGLLTWATFPRLPDGYHWFTKDQYLARRAELQNKPGWGDAPEWATALAQDSAMEDGLGAWWWHEFAPTECERTWSSQGRSYPAKERGEVLGDWRDTVEQRPVSAGISCSEAAAGLKAFTVKAADTIDWSAAPEGATHHIGGDKLEFPWHQELSHIRYWNGEEWIKRSAFRTTKEAIAKGFAVVARPEHLGWAPTLPVEHIKFTFHVMGSEEVKPVTVTNETVPLEQPGVVAGTGARSYAQQAFLIGRVIDLLRTSADHFSADELDELYQLCDAELTKRDAAVCGGENGRKFVLVLGDGTFGKVESGSLTWTVSLERATLMAEAGWEQFKRFGKLAEVRHGKLVIRVGGTA